jgi:hypothetical protein
LQSDTLPSKVLVLNTPGVVGLHCSTTEHQQKFCNKAPVIICKPVVSNLTHEKFCVRPQAQANAAQQKQGNTSNAVTVCVIDSKHWPNSIVTAHVLQLLNLQQKQQQQCRTCTSKFQLPLLGSSQTTSVVATSQQMVRLSLLQDSSRLWSWGHHDMPSTPCAHTHMQQPWTSSAARAASALNPLLLCFTNCSSVAPGHPVLTRTSCQHQLQTHNASWQAVQLPQQTPLLHLQLQIAQQPTLVCPTNSFTGDMLLRRSHI